MKRMRGIVIFTLFVGGCLTSEYLSHRRVDPTGRVSNLREYLAWRPAAEQFATLDFNGKPHVIAYGPMSSWLLLSSGPSAYVFDETGRLVDWSSDIGDDSEFDERWSAQRARLPGRATSRVAVEQIAATQPAG